MAGVSPPGEKRGAGCAVLALAAATTLHPRAAAGVAVPNAQA
jgi:hypothetical protein